MIPTRIHGVIDYLAVLGVEALSRLGFSRRVSRLLAGSARVHGLYAVTTDYEFGAGPLPMRGHLAIDACIGAGFCAAGLLMRDEPVPVRCMLVGMGLTELLLVSLTEPTPRRSRAHPPAGPDRRLA